MDARHARDPDGSWGFRYLDEEFLEKSDRPALLVAYQKRSQDRSLCYIYIRRC